MVGFLKPKLAKEVQREDALDHADHFGLLGFIPPGRQHGKLENPLSNEGFKGF